jgi:hypothetical protein
MRSWGPCLFNQVEAPMGSRLKKHRQAACAHQGGVCYYCRCPIWEGDLQSFSRAQRMRPRLARHLQATAEHLTARADGGKDSARNIVAACLWCNQQRHRGRAAAAPSASEYRARVQQFVAARIWHPLVASRAAQQTHLAGSATRDLGSAPAELVRRPFALREPWIWPVQQPGPGRSVA